MAAAAYLALIYGTLGLMPVFFNWIFSFTGRAGFSIAINIFIAAAAALILYLARGWLLPLGPSRAVGLVFICAGYGMIIYWADSPASRLHSLQYGLLSLLLSESLRGALPPAKLHAVTLLVVILASLVDEGIQWLLPNRSGLILEVIQNFGSAALAQATIITLKDSRGGVKGWAANLA